jgi:hypothetical protein
VKNQYFNELFTPWFPHCHEAEHLGSGASGRNHDAQANPKGSWQGVFFWLLFFHAEEKYHISYKLREQRYVNRATIAPAHKP